MNAPGRREASVATVLPGPVQTVPLVELYAVELALRHAVPPMDVAVDCYALIDGLLAGREGCLAE
eukprot:590222-Lingulodinium_polyedra.AAC.1